VAAVFRGGGGAVREERKGGRGVERRFGLALYRAEVGSGEDGRGGGGEVGGAGAINGVRVRWRRFRGVEWPGQWSGAAAVP
jgi:hypothetical protein